MKSSLKTRHRTCNSSLLRKTNVRHKRHSYI